tara:strand:+ start:892 stop:1098 length:207 start_codon:yes stop_codon:yes gene_type:complete
MKKSSDKILKDLNKDVNDVLKLVEDITNIDLETSDKVFDKKSDILINKAKNIKKNIEEKYLDNLDSKE